MKVLIEVFIIQVVSHKYKGALVPCLSLCYAPGWPVYQFTSLPQNYESDIVLHEL